MSLHGPVHGCVDSLALRYKITFVLVAHYSWNAQIYAGIMDKGRRHRQFLNDLDLVDKGVFPVSKMMFMFAIGDPSTIFRNYTKFGILSTLPHVCN